MGRLSVNNLGKAYKRYPNKWLRLAEWLGRGPTHEAHWVLQDISFDVQPGESVGIIGINGAGKSTLLKLIAGVMTASTGTIHTEGRVAALLELGMGFQAEFTGRQNVYMSGLLAGMSNAEIAHEMPAIEAFAEIGDYIDQPVRTYSSGMQVRLAFSVATAVRPDILIVDEALAVGDIFFQQKCFDRIRSFQQAGTTLLFVSHALSTVYALCDRALLIDQGRIARDASPREVIDLYNALVAARSATGAHPIKISEGDSSAGLSAGSYSHAGVAIESVCLRSGNAPAHSVVSGSELEAELAVSFAKPLDDPHIGFQIRDRRGEAVFMTHTHAMGTPIGEVRPGDRLRISFRFRVPLVPGDYTLTVGVAANGMLGGAVRDSLARIQDAWSFSIVRDLDDIHWDGVCNLAPRVSFERTSATTRSLPPGATTDLLDALHPPPGLVAAPSTSAPRLQARHVLVTTSHALLVVDIESGSIHTLHRGAGLYYGITASTRHLMVAARQRMVSSQQPQHLERGLILLFDHDLRPCGQWNAPLPLRDLHEIAFYRDTLWISCSFDNAIVLRHPDGRWERWHPLGVPPGDQDAHKDLNHFNSFAFTGDKLHLLAHNRGPSERLVFDLATRTCLERHPLGVQAHNLWSADGAWFTCSSGEGRLVSDHGFDLHTGGFPRGICRLGGKGCDIVLGLSQIAERDQRDLSEGQLLVFDAHWQLKKRVLLPAQGLVLDIKPWPFDIPTLRA